MSYPPGELSVLASAVVNRRTRAVDVVQHALQRIDELDPGLNAVVARRDEQALEEARQIDETIVRGRSPGPLAGVPVLVKDYEDVAGMRTTCGSVLLSDAPLAAEHSTVPARLVAAGAVIVGKSNLPEFATEGYTSNLLFGTTGNPWALEYSPGGSSGGSAAAVASGMVPIGTATDGGGSIRIPAAFCGLVGLKPTNGVIGRWPTPDWIDYSTEGPFATSVDDLALLLQVESGPVAGDPGTPPYLPPPSEDPISSLWVVERFASDEPLSPEVGEVFLTAVQRMAQLLDLKPQRTTHRELFGDVNPDDDWYTTAASEHVSRFGREWVEAGLSRMHPGTRSFMEYGLQVDVNAYLTARRRRYHFIRAMDQLLADDAIVVSPTVPVSGWLADGRMSAGEEPGMQPPEAFNTAIQNITGHPTLSLPAGRCANGVPFGLQVTAARFRDRDLLELASRWEQAHPWPRVADGCTGFSESIGLR